MIPIVLTGQGRPRYAHMVGKAVPEKRALDILLLYAALRCTCYPRARVLYDLPSGLFVSINMAIASVVWGIVALVAYLVYRQSSQRNQRKLPPGPKPLPIFGNIKDFPPDGTPEYQHWLHHKDLYGGISSVTVMGMTLVILHDKTAAHALLEQNASKTSGRPEMVMANKLCGYESIVLCQGYTSTFRRYRRYLHQELGTMVSAAQFHDAQEIEVNRQLVRALNEPGKWIQHFKT